MSTINLNDEKYEVSAGKVIFNGGKAGVVNNCKVRFESKKATDSDQAPKYKVIFTDENGGEINIGFFSPKDTASDAAKALFVKQMKHLANVFDVELAPSYESYDALMDATVKACYTKQEQTLVSVGAAYGTIGYPKAYLTIRWFFDIVKNNGVVYMAKDALYERPAPTEQVPTVGNAPTVPGNDLPF